MSLSKTTIIAAPTQDVFRQSSDIIAALGPAAKIGLQLHHMLSHASLYLFLRIYFLAEQVLHASKILAVGSTMASRFLVANTALLTREALRSAWNSKSGRRLRKKLEYEFFTFVLGSGGNSLILVIFWPGWWAAGFLLLMTWICASMAKFD